MTAPLAPSPLPVGEVVSACRGLLEEAMPAQGRSTVWALPTEQLPEAVRQVLALRAQADGLLCELVREVETRGVPVASGAKDTVRWLRSAGRLSHPAARELTALAAVTDPAVPAGREACPATAAALRAGQLHTEHAKVIATAMRDLPGAVDDHDPAVRPDAEAFLADQATTTLDPRELAVVARAVHEQLVQRAGAVDVDDPAEAERLAREAELHAYRNRSVTTSRHGRGLSRVRMILPDEVATGLLTALDTLAPPLPEDDGVRDDRTVPQRHADAVEELVALALDSARLPDRGGERPHITVTTRLADLQALLPEAGTLDTGEPLTAGTLRRLLCDAQVIPIVLGGQSQPLDLGRERRTFDRYQRRALLARDGGCAGPGCGPHPARAQAHHMVWWERGGRTDLADGALLCPPWHRRVHAEGWDVRLGPNGHPELIPPPWIDPQQRPRQNHRFRERPGTGG